MSGRPLSSSERTSALHDFMSHPYQDPGLEPARRADDLLARLSLDDKVGLMFQPLAGVGAFDAPGLLHYPSTRTLFERRINHFNTLQALSVREMAEWANAVQREIRRRPPGIPATISATPATRSGTIRGPGWRQVRSPSGPSSSASAPSMTQN